MRSWPAFAALAVIIAIWGAISSMGVIPGYLLPSPAEVWSAFTENSSDFLSATESTARSTLWGFAFSAILGFLLALLLILVPFLKRAFLPFAVFFQTVPVVALAPLLVIWFGFGEPTVRASAFIVSFFPVLASGLTGLSQASETDLELFKAYGASRMRTLWHLQIPVSLLSYLSGLQVAAGLAVIGAIVGEFVAGGGLGGLIDSARTQQRVDLVFAAILISSGLGVFLVSAIRWMGKGLQRWRPYFPPDAL